MFVGVLRCKFSHSTIGDRVGWGKMNMVGQSESDYIFVPELKAKELTVTGSSVLPFLIQWDNKNVDLISPWVPSFLANK